MKEKCTTNVDKWPEVGCGARCVPWARGASMVMEMRMTDGTWEAFMAERFPEALDDEIKKVPEAFYLSAQQLEPEALKD
eukprot:10739690-Prorocentrum_lima.AAC.1